MWTDEKISEIDCSLHKIRYTLWLKKMFEMLMYNSKEVVKRTKDNQHSQHLPVRIHGMAQVQLRALSGYSVCNTLELLHDSQDFCLNLS